MPPVQSSVEIVGSLDFSATSAACGNHELPKGRELSLKMENGIEALSTQHGQQGLLSDQKEGLSPRKENSVETSSTQHGQQDILRLRPLQHLWKQLGPHLQLLELLVVQVALRRDAQVQVLVIGKQKEGKKDSRQGEEGARTQDSKSW